MSSSDAAGYLIAHMSGDARQRHRALILVQHISWKPADQLRLARHFLGRHPHAHSTALAAFASFMSLKNFAKIVTEVWPSDPWHIDLFKYQLGGALQHYETSEENRATVAAILSR